jgi:hypothetical protein
MIKYKSYISVHSVDSSEAGGKEIAVLNLVANLCCGLLWNTKKTRTKAQRARRFLEGMSLPNPKNYNKGQAICILNPEGIPSHSPGLPLGNVFSNVATRRHGYCHALSWVETHGYPKMSLRDIDCKIHVKPRVAFRPTPGFDPLTLRGSTRHHEKPIGDRQYTIGIGIDAASLPHKE